MEMSRQNKHLRICAEFVHFGFSYVGQQQALLGHVNMDAVSGWAAVLCSCVQHLVPDSHAVPWFDNKRVSRQ